MQNQRHKGNNIGHNHLMSMQTLYDTLLHHNYTTAQSKQIFTIQRSAKYREPQKVNIGPDIQPHNLT